MKTIPITEAFVAGAASVEPTAAGIRPWRLPHTQGHLFTSPEEALLDRAACTSGVRLRFTTNATRLELRFAPLAPNHAAVPAGHAFDLVVDNGIVEAVRCPGGDATVRFERLPGRGVVEIWLPPTCPVTLRELVLDDGDYACPIPDRRPLWVTWGSSLTHCVRAGSAARTWPATVARRHDLNLLCLGFGGQCHIDPTVAMFIRDLPASFISLKLGINTIGGSVNGRTYPALVTAAVAIIREKHPHTPLALVSPIGFPPRETDPGPNGYTIMAMRRDMAAIQQRLSAAGDRNLYYVDGLEIFSTAEIEAYTEDQCHPNADGIDLMAAHFSAVAMPLLLGRLERPQPG